MKLCLEGTELWSRTCKIPIYLSHTFQVLNQSSFFQDKVSSQRNRTLKLFEKTLKNSCKIFKFLLLIFYLWHFLASLISAKHRAKTKYLSKYGLQFSVFSLCLEKYETRFSMPYEAICWPSKYWVIRLRQCQSFKF